MSATAPSARRTRISWTRFAVVVASVAAVSFVGVRAVSAAFATPVVPGPTGFAAYVDVTAMPAYAFETPSGPAQSHVVLSFVVADPSSPCTPSWGGAYSLDQAASTLELDRRLAQLRLTGGDAAVSFGGQRGSELSTVCTQPPALREAYRAVVDRYQVSSIDLDIEGSALDDTASIARRATAVRGLQDDEKAQGRDLAVWLTLPVSTSGLTTQGVAVVDSMLSAGVDLAGVNGLTMDLGVTPTAAQPMSSFVLQAARALQTQVSAAYGRVGIHLDATQAWGKVGMTPMIGQNDLPAEVFTLADAGTVNQFARDQGVGRLSMWSLNRDSTCRSPLPTVLSVVQTSCSGVDQGDASYAAVLAAHSDGAPLGPQSPAPTTSPTATPVATPSTPSSLVDDPAHSPFPIWDPLGTYPGGTKVVWHHQVYQARYWTTGFAPDTPVASSYDSPWTLLGPVLPGDTPAPLPTLAPGTYPQWDPAQAYVAGSRVQLGLVPYQAKWWTQGQKPGVAVSGGSPWVLVAPGG
ncbi:MAG: glycosyl hydrolase family 18 [Frankiales bacterium]|nr:glycosyl hydrolase family 18 [Frankiales bacterium]